MTDTATLEAAPASPPALGGPAPAAPVRHGALIAASLLASAAGAALLAALVAIYVGLRDQTPGDQWPLPDVTIPNVAALVLTITMVMSAATAGWMAYAARRDDRRGVLWGGMLTLLFAAAHLNGLSFVLKQLGLVLADSPYAASVYSLVGAHTAFLIAGLVAIMAAVVRGAGGGLTAERHEVATASALVWQFVVVAWLVVYTFVFLVK